MLKISTNANSHNKENAGRLSRGWENEWKTPQQLAEWVQQGHAWCGTHFRGGHRTQDNADGSNCIVFDFDGELQLDDFWATTTAQQWCCLTYTSASSTDEVNRFRAVFPLEGIPLSSNAEHKAVYKFIAQKLSDELSIEFKDDCGQKPERLWFGNTDALLKFNNNASVPFAVIQDVDVPPEPTYDYDTPKEITDLDARRCIWLLGNLIPPSQDGEYNESYVRVTAACASIGDVMIEAWLDWVSRGHHGSKPSNLCVELKWRGLGQRSGPSSLYAMAKAANACWRSCLPADLQFTTSFEHSQQIFENFMSGRISAPKRLFKSVS